MIARQKVEVFHNVEYQIAVWSFPGGYFICYRRDHGAKNKRGHPDFAGMASEFDGILLICYKSTY
jgi:hypothetical protein